MANTMFDKYLKDFGKAYSDEEYVRRKIIFQENIKIINEHNEKYDRGETSFTMGINQFTDMTQEEFSSFVSGGLCRKETDTFKTK